MFSQILIGDPDWQYGGWKRQLWFYMALGVTLISILRHSIHVWQFLDPLNIFPFLVPPIEVWSQRVIDSGLSPWTKYFSFGVLRIKIGGRMLDTSNYMRDQGYLYTCKSRKKSAGPHLHV